MQPDFLQEDFHRFAFTGDEWLIAYAHLSSTFLVVYPTTFAFAMTLELYCKAYSAFLHRSDATRHGHRIARLFEELQDSDPSFPPTLRLTPRLSSLPLHELDKDWSASWFKALPPGDQEDIRANYEVYMVMAYGPDLKYGASPALARDSGRVIYSSWGRLNPWLAQFVCWVRARIGHPLYPQAERLRGALSYVNPPAKIFLEGIMSGTPPGRI